MKSARESAGVFLAQVKEDLYDQLARAESEDERERLMDELHRLEQE